MKRLKVLARAGVLWASVGSLLAAGCDGGADSVEGSNEALTTEQQNILGFEAPKLWTTLTGPVTTLSDDHTQGLKSLKVTPKNYVPYVSNPLASFGPVGSTLSYDLRLPSDPAHSSSSDPANADAGAQAGSDSRRGSSWRGASQVYISIPSKQVYAYYAGQVELTGLPLNTWNTLSFTLSSSITKLISAGSYNDLRITIVLNVPWSSTGTYLLDNVRFSAAAGGGTGGAVGTGGRGTGGAGTGGKGTGGASTGGASTGGASTGGRGTGGASTGGKGTGGASTGGASTGGASTGGKGTGGASTGGVSTGGASTGGRGTGGASTGGASTGGASTGGRGTGGASTGGASTGGASTGGASTGGRGTGGASTGGASTGGASTGGASTGGASTGGASTGGRGTGGASTGGASTGGASTGGAGTGGAGTGGAGTGGSNNGSGPTYVALQNAELATGTDPVLLTATSNTDPDTGDQIAVGWGPNTLPTQAERDASFALIRRIRDKGCATNSTNTGPGTFPTAGCLLGVGAPLTNAFAGIFGDPSTTAVNEYKAAAIASGLRANPAALPLTAASSNVDFGNAIAAAATDPTNAVGLSNNIAQVALQFSLPQYAAF